jgi:hypothetical protein
VERRPGGLWIGGRGHVVGRSWEEELEMGESWPLERVRWQARSARPMKVLRWMVESWEKAALDWLVPSSNAQTWRWLP